MIRPRRNGAEDYPSSLLPSRSPPPSLRWGVRAPPGAGSLSSRALSYVPYVALLALALTAAAFLASVPRHGYADRLAQLQTHVGAAAAQPQLREEVVFLGEADERDMFAAKEEEAGAAEAVVPEFRDVPPKFEPEAREEVALDDEKLPDEDKAEEETEAPEVLSGAAPADGMVGGGDVGGTFDGVDLTLFKQITLPERPIIQHYDDTLNYWPLHAILKERGWTFATQAPPARVTLWISKGVIPPRMKEGYQMLNSMGVSGCVGGAKSLQLECRRRLARAHGCEYEELGIQPAQYNLLHLDDCKRFFEDAEKHPERAEIYYLSKPTFTFHGAGIRIHHGIAPTLKNEFGACKSPKNMILMDYIANPATMMGGYKFDFRTYMLVASLKPQLVFYHDGFVRKSDKRFTLESKDLNVHITNKASQSKDEHFFNFSTLAHELHREHGLPLDHMDKYVRTRAQAVTRFMFHTTLIQPNPPRHVPGRFHLFGIDWLLDSKGKLHLLEGNGYPLVTHYPTGLTPRVWEEMTDLILAIQTKPETLAGKKMTVKAGYAFGGWKLVYNELEETMEKANNNAYNACNAFREGEKQQEKVASVVEKKQPQQQQLETPKVQDKQPPPPPPPPPA
jgi:hypothetical protein